MSDHGQEHDSRRLAYAQRLYGRTYSRLVEWHLSRGGDFASHLRRSLDVGIKRDQTEGTT